MYLWCKIINKTPNKYRIIKFQKWEFILFFLDFFFISNFIKKLMVMVINIFASFRLTYIRPVKKVTNIYKVKPIK